MTDRCSVKVLQQLHSFLRYQLSPLFDLALLEILFFFIHFLCLKFLTLEKKNTITVNKAYIKQIKPTLLKNTKM